jgi:hypothetical protein
MYHPYIRQKIFEAKAWELERIAEEDRTGRVEEDRARVGEPATPARRLAWSRFRLSRRRVTVPRSVRSDAGGLPGDG